MEIVTREGKGSPLSYEEMDNNLKFLAQDKIGKMFGVEPIAVFKTDAKPDKDGVVRIFDLSNVDTTKNVFIAGDIVQLENTSECQIGYFSQATYDEKNGWEFTNVKDSFCTNVGGAISLRGDNDIQNRIIFSGNPDATFRFDLKIYAI